MGRPSHQIPRARQLLNLTPASVAAGAEFAVQLPVEARPVVDDGPRDEKYATHICEDSRSRCWSFHLGE